MYSFILRIKRQMKLFLRADDQKMCGMALLKPHEYEFLSLVSNVKK